MKFYLGTHHPHWLATAGFPLFVSHRRLMDRRSLPQAIAPWALDSGAFTQLNLRGVHLEAQSYVQAVRRYRSEIGLLEWAAPQDWMCEPAVLERTGLTVVEHQRRTIENLVDLRWQAPDLPFIPVLQGWTIDDYERCADGYEGVGVELHREPLVGLGSVCRRQSSGEIEAIVSRMAARGIRLHGFGVKRAGLSRYAGLLTSADSMSWSFDARMNHPPLPGCTHKRCANCLRFATWWRAKRISELQRVQMHLAVG